MVQAPTTSEYPPHLNTYIGRVTSTNIIEQLERNKNRTYELLEGLTDEQANFRYAPGKWSLKELLGHMTDTERIMSYRALCIARGETASLPGFEEDDYVKQANFAERELASLLEDYSIGRQATIKLLERFPEYAWIRMGRVNNRDISVRALAYVIVGHETHHQQVMMERYLNEL